jgi:hypothetical protein
VVLYGQTAAEEGVGQMSDLVQQFRRFHPNGTRQIGQYFCFPAVVCNAIRVLGSDEYSQEKIRDAWYAMKGRIIEADINQQMTGAGPDVVDALVKQTDFAKTFVTTPFEQPPEKEFFNEKKAEYTIQFIAENVGEGSPVLISTDYIPWEQGILTRLCCHMWLALHVDIAGNTAICHDPGNDLIFQIPVQMVVPITLGGKTAGIEIGLRGRLTTSNYFCLAFSRK